MEENKAKTTESGTYFGSSGSADAGIATSEGAGYPANDSLNDTAFADYSDSDGDKGGYRETGGKTAQSAEQNRENARRRREAEKEKLVRQTREATIIEALDGRNPYTGEEMKDSLDVEEYLAMKEIAKNGGDPVADYPSFRKTKERDAAQSREAREKQENWYKNDREAFVARHPNVDLDALIADRRFRSFARGKTGEVPLNEIYEEFVELVGEYEEDARNMAAQMLANGKASPGALSTSRSVGSDFFTPEQVRRMSRGEIKANYEKIRASMMKWK